MQVISLGDAKALRKILRNNKAEQVIRFIANTLTQDYQISLDQADALIRVMHA